MSSRRLGMIQILLSGVCFGFLGIFGKQAYQQGVTPGELLSLRFLLGSLWLAFYVSLTRPQALRVRARQLANCAALGVLGYAVFSSCFFEALQGLSASLTVLLLYIYPVIVSVGAWVFLGEGIPRSRWIALPLTMLGLMALIWGDFQVARPMALVFGVGSAIFYSIYILFSSRMLRGQDAFVSVVYIQLFAGLALAGFHWRDPGRLVEVVSRAWPTLVAVSLVCSAGAMSLFIAGLGRLKNWEASVLSTAEPITGILAAILVLGERLSLLQALGGLAVLVAFLVVAYPSEN